MPFASPRKDPANTAAAPADASKDTSKLADLESRKQKKEMRESGIELFNKKPVKGIKFLQEQGFVATEALDVARFLHSEDRLDRGAIGDYLGEKDDFNIAVMHAYIDQVDFSRVDRRSNTAFLDALRIFLGSFRLPGESQKIDRLMEKFAQRYCQVFPDNGIFASADAAYVVAFSIIMLTTDLHNAQVKRKITKEGFFRMTRGINDNKDLPRDFLEDIFDAVAKEEIKMNSMHQHKEIRALAAVPQQGMKTLAASAAEEMNRRRVDRSLLVAANDVEHVRPVFKLIWKPVLAALSAALSTFVEPAAATIALEGLSQAIHIACLFGLTAERDTLVKTLAGVAVVGPAADTRSRSIEAVNTLLLCALRDGNTLGENWRDVLQCMSQLEHAQRMSETTDAAASKAFMSLTTNVDKIFSKTRTLNGDAIVDFVRAICAVALEELTFSPPRIYSLSKLVDVAHYNMQRVRIEWAHIWAVMGEIFNKVGCIANSDVSCFAVDSLRQLSTKFLEKGELDNYTFQKDFLRPFEYIMNRNKDAAIRDMVVRCIAQMVQAKSANIRSGWKNIFFVLSLAATDSDRSTVDLAFNTTCHIFDTCFSSHTRSVVISLSFMDAVNCMTEFACNLYFPDISVAAIKQLRSCASHVGDSPELFVSVDEPPAEEPKIWVRGWFPVLFGLSRIVNRGKLDVRTLALSNMFEIMKLYGAGFSDSWWTDLFRIVFRMFEEKQLETMTAGQERQDWLGITCSQALRAVVEVTHQYFGRLETIVLADLLKLLETSIGMGANEQLSRAGTECLHQLVSGDGLSFSDASWQALIDTMQRLFKRTTPQELVSYTFRDEWPEDEAQRRDAKAAQQDYNAAIILKCVIQLELIQTVEFVMLVPEPTSPRAGGQDKDGQNAQQQRSIARAAALARAVDRPSLLFTRVTSARLFALLDCLAASHKFALEFNANTELRHRLWKAGFMRNKSKPNLLRQEIASFGVMLRVLFRMYTDAQRADVRAAVEQRLTAACQSVLHQYAAEVPREARESWVPLVLLVLRELLALDDEQFMRNASAQYAALSDLLLVGFDAPLGDVTFLLAEFFHRARRFAL